MHKSDQQIRAHIRSRLLTTVDVAPQVSYDELKRTEWCPKFERLQRNRLIMGSFRYGRLYDKNRPRHDNVKSMRKRLGQYLQTGNQELLVDVANLCMVEYVRPGSHPHPHWAPVDDGEHVETMEVHDDHE